MFLGKFPTLGNLSFPIGIELKYMGFLAHGLFQCVSSVDTDIYLYMNCFGDFQKMKVAKNVN